MAPLAPQLACSSYVPVLVDDDPTLWPNDVESSPLPLCAPAPYEDTQQDTFRPASPTLYHSSPRRHIALFSTLPRWSPKAEVHDDYFNRPSPAQPQRTIAHQVTRLSSPQRFTVSYPQERSLHSFFVRYFPFTTLSHTSLFLQNAFSAPPSYLGISEIPPIETKTQDKFHERLLAHASHVASTSLIEIEDPITQYSTPRESTIESWLDESNSPVTRESLIHYPDSMRNWQFPAHQCGLDNDSISTFSGHWSPQAPKPKVAEDPEDICSSQLSRDLETFPQSDFDSIASWSEVTPYDELDEVEGIDSSEAS